MRNNNKKRLMSAGLALSMLPSFNILASAKGVQFVGINGISEAFQTLTGIYEYDGVSELSYEWLVSDSENGSFSSIGERDKSLYVSQNYEDKWIKFSVSDGEDTYWSSAIKIGPKWGMHKGIDNEKTKFSVVNESTPNEYIFTVDGMRYILLDVTESDASKFLVMTDRTVGSRQFANTKTNVFNDMAAFLNNKSTLEVYVRNGWTKPSVTNYTTTGYIGNTDYSQLSNVILENINSEHIWKIEERKLTGRAEGERAVKAGIVLPSITETERYCERIGLYDANGFWYRTPSSTQAGGAYSASAAKVNLGKASDTNFDSNLGIRPMFYLDKSFFTDAKIPVSQLGSGVIADIKKAYSKDELTDIYTDDILNNIFGYADDARIENIKMRDGAGNIIYDISGSDKIIVSVTILNANKNVLGAAYAAIYDSDKRLKSIAKTDLEMKRDSRNIADIDVDNKNPAKGDELKVFVWDSRQSPIVNLYKHDSEFCVRTEGIYETKMTVNAVIEGLKYADYRYQWVISDSKNGKYLPISGGTEPRLEIPSDLSEKWIKVRAELGNGEYSESEPRQIGKRWQRTSNTSLEGCTSPDKDDMFKIDGQEFILLDKFESDKDRYLVLCEEPVTKRVYSSGAGQQPKEMMEWLNGNEFKNAGYLPKAIFRHLDENAVWKLEPYAYFNNDGANIVENTIAGGIALPAVSEVKKYIDKITLVKEGGWWSRTPYASSFGGDGNCVLGSSADALNGGTFYPYYSKDASMGIRPVFYLDRDFFTKERIDLESIGRNIRNILIADYEKSEFTAYSQSEREILLNTGFVEAKLEHVMDSAGGNIPIAFHAKTNEEHTYKFTLTADGTVVSQEELHLNNKEMQEEEKAVEISGIYDTNLPLKVQNPYSGGSISWYVSDTYQDGYTLIEGETKDVFIPVQDYANKFIKAVVTDGDKIHESEPIVLNDRWHGKNQGPPNGEEVDNAEKNAKIASAVIGTTFDNTPEKYIFDIGGQDFILLDIMNDDESRFLVMSRKAIGQRTITTNGQIPADIMCWLNNKESVEVSINGTFEPIAGAEDYTKTGYLSDPENFTALPKGIKEGINYNAYWKQEPKMYGGDVERVYRAGISIPAVTEIERYYDKFGWKDSGTKYTWTRTGHANRGDGEQMLSYNTDWARGTLYPNTAYKKAGGNSFGIRPVFYLKNDFFLNNAVSLTEVGSEVRNAILESYSAEQLLSAGYDKAEVLKYCGAAGGLEGETYYLSTAGLDNGIYDMILTVELDGVKISEDEKTVCYMPEYRAQFMDFYSTKGYCDSLSGSWAYDYAMKSGVKMMRIGEEWHGIEREKGVYNFESLDRRIGQLTEDGVELVFLMAYGNPLYSDGIKTGPANKEAIDAFAKCLSTIAERYPQIEYFEVYNEPNLTGFWQPAENHRDYTYLLQVCDREVRKTRPDAKVAGGVLADGGANWLLNMLTKNAYPYLDVSSFHPYIYWGKNRVDTIYQSKLDEFMNKTLLYGGFKENIISEVGWPSFNTEHRNGCTVETQALETVKQYVFAEANGINRIMAYNFVNSGYNYNEPEHNFGIVTRDGLPKPAYLSNAVLRNMIAGGVYVGEITFGTDDISHGYLYQKDGKPLLVLWKDFPKGANEADISGSVEFTGESLTVYDMAGNIKQRGIQVVNLGSEIVYIEELSDNWYAKAVRQSYEKTLNSRLKALGMEEYASYFTGVLSEIKNLSDQLVSENEAKALFDRHFAIADKIIADYKSGALEIQQTSLSSLLDVVYETGVFAANYYMAAADENSAAAVSERAAFENTDNKIKVKEDTEAGGYLPYSNAMLEIADNHLEMAERVSAVSEGNPNKAGFVKSRNAIAKELIEMADNFSEFENLTYDDFILHAPSEQVNLEIGKQGTVVFSIYNFDDKPLEGAEIVVTDYNGGVLARDNVRLAAGESKKVSMNLTVQSKEVLSGGYGYAYLKIGDKTLKTVLVKLIA